MTTFIEKLTKPYALESITDTCNSSTKNTILCKMQTNQKNDLPACATKITATSALYILSRFFLGERTQL